MEDKFVKKTVKHLEALSEGATGTEIETLSTKGLKLVEARQGFLRFHFVVQNYLLDKNGNWEAGAIATLIDNLGANAVYSILGKHHVTVEFSVSYFSTVKLREEVEIVAKVVADKGKLVAHVVEITRKINGELIAIGKQWMTLRPLGKLPVQSKNSRAKL